MRVTLGKDTSAETQEKQLADQWLAGELNRIWLVAERCVRQLQKAQLRAQPDHPSMAEIEGIFTARRTARGASGLPDEAEVSKALADADGKMAELRRAAPIGRLIENLSLRPLEVEALVVAMAPHIDAPLADVFNLIRGGSPIRRGVDLALIAQLFQLKRNDRVALLDVMDPERPLLNWKLVQTMPAESIEAYGSVNYRAIQPTFDLLSVLCGRAELSPALYKAAELIRVKATLDDLILDEATRARLQTICESAAASQKAGRFTQMPWLVIWGAKGSGKVEFAARVAAYAGRPLLVFRPLSVDKTVIEDSLRRAMREALLRGALFYLGPLMGDILADNAKELARRLVGYPAVVALGCEGLSAPRLSLDHPLQELEVGLQGEPGRLELWNKWCPPKEREEGTDLTSLARGFKLTPGEIIDTSIEALALAKAEKGRKVTYKDLRGGVDRRLRN